MILRSISVTLVLFTVIFLTESTEASPHNNSLIGNALGLPRAFAIVLHSQIQQGNPQRSSATEAFGAHNATRNSIVIQTPATGALTANYTLPQPGSLSATNQAVATATVLVFTNNKLGGTVEPRREVIVLTKSIVSDDRFYTGSSGVSKWIRIAQATGFGINDISLPTSLDLNTDYATRYDQISKHFSNDINTDVTATMSLPNVGRTMCLASTHNQNTTIFYNASCMGQYYITVNFS